jgi:hypothetical protein
MDRNAANASRLPYGIVGGISCAPKPNEAADPVLILDLMQQKQE